MWRFICVLPDVIQQMLFTRKCFRTEVTTMRGFSGVPVNKWIEFSLKLSFLLWILLNKKKVNLPQYVVGEVFFAAEAFAADFATERILVRMWALVIGQMFLK